MTPQATPSNRPQQPVPSDRNGLLSRFFRFPLVWMMIGLIAVTLASAVNTIGRSGRASAVVFAFVAALLGIAVYWLVMRFVARRETPEIGRRGAGREALLGCGVGLGFVLVSVVLIMVLGGYSFAPSSHDVASVVVPLAALSVGAAVTEELMFRGLALQALERLCGSWVALVITGLFFGAAHLLNPGATLWSSVAIFIEAGLLLGAAFLWRRNIWFVAGLHFTWNAVEGLLGIPISGKVTPGLLTAEVNGPDLLTGGAFGLEASIVPVIVSLLIAVPMLLVAHRRGGLVPLLPSRRRNATARVT